LGVALAYLLGVLLNFLFPGSSLSLVDLSLVGASIFLTTTMKAPLTVVGLVVSFTVQTNQTLIPLIVIVALTTVYDRYLLQ